MNLKKMQYLQNADYFRHKNLPITVTVMKRHRNKTVPMHGHEFSELVVIASGKITHKLQDIQTELKAGDFFIIHPGDYHGYESPSPDLKLYNVLYNSYSPVPALLSARPSLLAEIYPDRPNPPIALGRISHQRLKTVSTLLDIMLTENPDHKCHLEITTGILFAAIVSELSVAYHPPKISHNKTSVIRACAFIDENYSRKISSDDLVRKIGLFKSSLRRLFIDAFGMAPSEYIQTVRIAKARTLMEKTDQTLHSIAASCGFYDASHLSKALKKCPLSAKKNLLGSRNVNRLYRT